VPQVMRNALGASGVDLILNYKNKYGDVLAFSIYTNLRNRLMQATFVFFAFMTLRANIQVATSADVGAVFRVVMVVIFEAVMISGLLAVALLAIALSLLPSQNRTFFTDHTLTLGPDGLREQTEFNDTHHTWAAIQKVARTRGHLFLYVSQNGAHVIPRRAVQTDDEWDSLFQLALQRAGGSA